MFATGDKLRKCESTRHVGEFIWKKDVRKGDDNRLAAAAESYLRIRDFKHYPQQ